MIKKTRVLPFVLLLSTGCSSPPAPPAADAEAAVELTTTLRGSVDIALKWTTVPRATGYAVEFATEPGGPYTLLQYVQSSQTTYEHSNVVPQTEFFYRVRPVYGGASAPVEVGLPPPPADENLDDKDHSWADPRVLPVAGGPVAKRSLRDGGAESAPTALQVEVMHTSGLRFKWVDRASDEDGFLLEVRPEGRPEYRVIAYFDPDINSAGLITMPEERRAAFRVRAFYYGKASNLGRQRSGAEPQS